jgi:hypothetical protein
MKYLCVLLAVSGVSMPDLCWADQGFQAAPNAAPNQAVSASARLDFITNIGKFVFLRVGTGAYPTTSATVDTVSFTLTASIPPTATVPANGNNTIVSWNKTAPTFGTTTNTVLPVEVRSNAGQVTLQASTTTPLTSGGNTIPMSSIVIATSDANLPAPVLPNAGIGASVNVVGSSFTNLVTTRAANWTFSYNNPTPPTAGSYTGQITFTASAP